MPRTKRPVKLSAEEFFAKFPDMHGLLSEAELKHFPVTCWEYVEESVEVQVQE